MSRTRFDTAELFRIIAGLAQEAIEARKASDDDADREMLDVYEDAAFQFEGFPQAIAPAPAAGTVPELDSALLGEAGSTIDDLLHQIGQMRGLFDDEDGAIAAAVESAEKVSSRIAVVRSSAGVVPELEICKVLTVSTAHLTQDEAEALESGGVSVIVHKYEHGLMVWTSGDEPDPEDDCGPSPELRALMDLAKANGCEWVRLDRDGYCVAGLPVFEW